MVRDKGGICCVLRPSTRDIAGGTFLCANVCAGVCVCVVKCGREMCVVEWAKWWLVGFGKWRFLLDLFDFTFVLLTLFKE